MPASVSRFVIVLALSVVVTLLAACTASTTVVYHNPLKRGIERPLFVDTTLLNPGAAAHPEKVDLTHWYTNAPLRGVDTLLFLESYPKSEIDTTYHPSEFVGAANPISRLSGSEDGRIVAWTRLPTSLVLFSARC